MADSRTGYAFISYSTKDQTMADATRNLFHQEGIRCWMAPYDIPAGSKYAHVIIDALKKCSCLVLLLTDEAQNSQFVEREVERAITYRKTIVTMKLEDVELNSGFEFFIGEGQIVAVHEINRNSPGMRKILDAVKVLTGTTSGHSVGGSSWVDGLGGSSWSGDSSSSRGSTGGTGAVRSTASTK